MRIRILKSVATIRGSFQAGDIADMPDDTARDWCRAGIAMLDKSIEPKEIKGNKSIKHKETKGNNGLYWCQKCGRSHERKSKIGKRHAKVN